MNTNVSQIFCGAQTDDYCRLDIRVLARAGALNPGYRVTWKAGQSEVDLLVGEGGLIAQGRAIPIVRTRMHFGGSRPWMVCPGCKKRRAVLYIGPYICQPCARLTYASLKERDSDRARRRAQKIRARLQWSSDVMDTEGSKPKWMRWPTYHRLTAQHAELKRRWLESYL